MVAEKFNRQALEALSQLTTASLSRADFQTAPKADAADRQRLDVPVVGRRAEYETLIKAHQRAQQHGMRLLTVRGRAGIGKTRLTEQFVTGLQHRAPMCSSAGPLPPVPAFPINPSRAGCAGRPIRIRSQSWSHGAAEPEGHLAEKRKGNIMVLPPLGVWQCRVMAGALIAPEAASMQARIEAAMGRP